MVNLAQRMESLAPPGGILVTEYTRAALKKQAASEKADAFPFSFSDKRELTVKGYDKPVAAYEVIF